MSQLIANLPLPELPASQLTNSSPVKTTFSNDIMARQLPSLVSVIFSDAHSQDQLINQAQIKESSIAFTPLDLINEAQQRNILKRESNQSALQIAMFPNQNLTNSKLLQILHRSTFPIKTMLLINRLANDFWEARRASTSDGFDQKQTLLFTYLLIGAFQLKFLSVEELRCENEALVHHLIENQLTCFVIRLTQKIVGIMGKDSQKKDQRWKELLEKMDRQDSSVFCRMIISQSDELYSLLNFEETNLNPIFQLKNPPQCEKKELRFQKESKLDELMDLSKLNYESSLPFKDELTKEEQFSNNPHNQSANSLTSYTNQMSNLPFENPCFSSSLLTEDPTKLVNNSQVSSIQGEKHPQIQSFPDKNLISCEQTQFSDKISNTNAQYASQSVQGDKQIDENNSVSEGKADCNDFSMISQGKVTDIDISLPFLQLNDSRDDSQIILNHQTEVENITELSQVVPNN